MTPISFGFLKGVGSIFIIKKYCNGVGKILHFG